MYNWTLPPPHLHRHLSPLPCRLAFRIVLVAASAATSTASASAAAVRAADACIDFRTVLIISSCVLHIRNAVSR